MSTFTDLTTSSPTSDGIIWGQIGGNINNQTDLIDELDLKQDLSEKGQPSGYAGLDSSGKVPEGQIPNAIPSQTGNGGKYLTTNGTAISWGNPTFSVTWGTITGTLSNQSDLATALAGKQDALGYTAESTSNKATNLNSPNDTKYPTVQAVVTAIAAITAGDIGLGNVDNTADLDKPISTATQTALDGKVDENAAITGATKMKITYDAKGLVTAGADAAIDDLSDVVISSAVNGQALTFNGTNWVNSTPAGGGDVTGQSESIDGEIALFSSTTGKAIKRATGTGFVYATDGVYSVVDGPTNSYKARVTRTTTQAISDNSETKVEFATETYDTNNNFDNATNYRYAAPANGYYQVNAQIAFAANSTGDRILTIKKNDTDFAKTFGNPRSGLPDYDGGQDFTGYTGYGVCNYSDVIYLDATDYIEVYAYQNSGGSLNIVGDGLWNFISVHFLS